ncbi:MAG: hypothetical protein NTZ27_11510 [Ignavibacteriales bacterium]|nr:hypothetical protein [Ignavibacteriales bacterium]
MRIERFSFTVLKKQLEEIELDVEKIEFIADEILRCKDAILDVRNGVRNIEPNEIKISLKTTNQENSLIDLVNCNEKIKQAVKMEAIQICGKTVCEEYNEFLERAEFLREHYKTKLEMRATWTDYSKTENAIVNDSGSIERIIWYSGKDKLLEMFDSLNKNEILPKYSKEEILIHFSDDKQNPFCRGFNYFKKFLWHDSDNKFSIFVDELAKRGVIDDENKFKIFAKHFLNKKGKPFKDLAQKKNYTKNYTQTGNLIGRILDSISISIIILFCTLPFLNDSMFEGITETLSYFI